MRHKTKEELDKDVEEIRKQVHLDCHIWDGTDRRYCRVCNPDLTFWKEIKMSFSDLLKYFKNES